MPGYYVGGVAVWVDNETLDDQMLNLGVGNMVRIALRIVARRQQIETTWLRAYGLFDEVQKLLPEINKLLREVAPELLPPAPNVVPITTGTKMMMRDGSVHEFDVEWLQESLNQLINANLKVDGIYGERTRDAVKKFQTSRGLTADGWAGIVTEAKLMEELTNWR